MCWRFVEFYLFRARYTTAQERTPRVSFVIRSEVSQFVSSNLKSAHARFIFLSIVVEAGPVCLYVHVLHFRLGLLISETSFRHFALTRIRCHARSNTTNANSQGGAGIGEWTLRNFLVGPTVCCLIT